MREENAMQIELWAQVFKEFKQVKRISVDSSRERLDIIVEGHNKKLQAISKELDKSLLEFGGNPHEVVTSFLKKHGILVYYQNTLVGFFDIQAYSAFIEHTGIVEAIRRIT